MVTLLTIVHITVCLFLILVVLLQAGKGGGMGIAFGGTGSQTVFGSSGAGNFLTRLTSITATVFLLTSLALAHYSSRQDSKRLQELGAQKAVEKKSDDEKAAKLKADLEKARAAAAVGKDGGAGGTPPFEPPRTPASGPTMPLQLKLPGTPPHPGFTVPSSPKPAGTAALKDPVEDPATGGTPTKGTASGAATRKAGTSEGAAPASGDGAPKPAARRRKPPAADPPPPGIESPPPPAAPPSPAE
jgi:preprotein translocase subunit SecG